MYTTENTTVPRMQLRPVLEALKQRYDDVKDHHLANIEKSFAGVRLDAFGEDRLDANESMLALQALQVIEATPRKVEYGIRKGRLLCPIKSNIPKGAKEYGYDLYDSAGIAQLYKGGTDDVPLVDGFKERVTFPVDMYALGYTMTIEDLHRAALTGEPIQNTKASQVADGFDERLELIIGQGRPGVANATGLFNNANVPIIAAAAAAAGGFSPVWGGADKTAEEVITDMTTHYDTIHTNTAERYRPDTVVMSLAKMRYITRTMVTRGQTTKSIWDWVTDQCPGLLNLETWHFAATASATSANAVLMYVRDPSAVHVAWHEPTQVPGLNKGLSFEIDSYSNAGCVVFEKPLTAARMDGV